MTMGDYPKLDRQQLVDDESVDTYLRTLFQNTRWKPNSFINARGIGEKGTDREGMFQEDCWAQPGVAKLSEGQDGDDILVRDVTGWVRVWAMHNVASYIVPAVLKEARGVSAAVESFPAVLVDLDSGDTVAKAKYLGEHLGQPTMVVYSGGTTDANTPKLHLYWVLDEPCEDIPRVVDMRHELARKIGGDLTMGRGVDSNPYGRAHQPIRIPGSVHAKGDHPNVVRLGQHIGACVDVDIFAESIRRMPDSPWVIEDNKAGATAGATGFDFGVEKNHRRSDPAQALTTKVYEGAEDKTRWSQFNQVAGHKIRLVRDGTITLDEAREQVHGWVLDMMVPPWPAARVDKEFRALCAKDEANRGPFPVATVDPERAASIVSDESGALGLREWATSRWAGDEDVPVRKFLVDGLILAGKPHLLVAEGGAGKTFAMLDLCMKVASRGEGETMEWMGKPVVGEPGTVVMLTTEDDRDELHIRLAGIDKDGRRFSAGDRLIVVPAVSTKRGAFTFGDRDRATGNVVPSAGWREFLQLLEELPDLRLVVIDTLNTTLHGEENSATVVNEYAKLVAPVCGRLGAALVVTHHIRKQDPKFPIKTTDDMAAAVRGSSALPAAFRVVLGLWHCSDFGRLMQALGETPRPKFLWRFGVLKANNPQMAPGVSYLLRGPDGPLVDVTARMSAALGDENAQRRAWLLAGVEAAASAGVPYIMAGKDAAGGVYGRRAELHPAVRGLGRIKLQELVDGLIDDGQLVVRQVEWRDARGRMKPYPTLDVRGGRFDKRDPERAEFGTGWDVPDWEGGWSFDPTTGEILPVDAPRFRMGLAGGKGAQADKDS